MTLEDEVTATRRHRIGYYLAIDGIATRFSTHNPSNEASWSPSGTFDASMVSMPDGSGQRLDKRKGIVMPGGFSCQLARSTSTLATFRIKGGTHFPVSSGFAVGSSLCTFSGAGAGQNGLVLHVGKEAILLGTHTSGGAFSGCTRGYLDTQAAPHAKGEIASTRPRHLKNRRGVLYAVNLDTGTEEAVRAGLMETPKFNDGVFELRFVDLMTALNQPVMTGWQEQTVISVEEATVLANPTGNAMPGFRFTVRDGRQLQDDGHIMFSVDGERVVMPLPATQTGLTSSGTFEVVWSKLAGTGPGDPRFSRLRDADLSVRQVGLINDSAKAAALMLMLSVEGEGDNDSTYDVLVGRSPVINTGTEDQLRKRIGAGLPAAWVDVTSWESIPNTNPGRIVLLLDEEARLFEVLSNEIIWRTGGYAYVTGAGKLSWKQYAPSTVRGALPDFTQDNFLQSSVTIMEDEDEQLARISWECNYIPGIGFTRKIGHQFEEAINIYDEDPEAGIDLKSKSVWSGPAVDGHQTTRATGPLELSFSLERVKSRTADGGRKIRVIAPMERYDVAQIGARWQYSDDRMPNMRGDATLSNLPVETIAVNPDYAAGTFEVEAEEIPTGVRIAPAAIVGAYDAGTRRITFDTNGIEATLWDADPGELFNADWTVRHYTAASNLSSSATYDLDSVTASSIVLSSVPSPLPVAGDLIVLEDGDETGLNANSSSALPHDYAFGADGNSQIGISSYLRDANTWQ